MEAKETEQGKRRAKKEVLSGNEALKLSAKL